MTMDAPVVHKEVAGHQDTVVLASDPVGQLGRWASTSESGSVSLMSDSMGQGIDPSRPRPLRGGYLGVRRWYVWRYGERSPIDPVMAVARALPRRHSTHISRVPISSRG